MDHSPATRLAERAALYAAVDALGPAHARRAFPLERWAARSPATRWPLVLLLIVLLIGLAGGATATTVGLDLASAHAPNESWYSNANPGVYVRLDNGATAGVLRNSLGRASVYGAYTAQWGWAGLIVGGVTGYQQRTAVFACPPSSGLVGTCQQQRGYSNAAIAPLLGFTAALPTLAGIVPRLTLLPSFGHGQPWTLHLSIEHDFGGAKP